MNKILAFQIFSIVFYYLPSTWAFTDCRSSHIQVHNATRFELQSSCDSLRKVVLLFKKAGIEITPEIKIFFEKQAEVTINGETIPVHGYFDDENFEIHITSFNSHRNSNLTPFGLKWDLNQSSSYVLHEMTHLAIATELGKNKFKIKREWHEFLAYAVQIELMHSDLKKMILAKYSKTKAFESPNSVNSLIYEMDPEMFGVKAYKSMEDWGGSQFLSKILRGDIALAIKEKGD
jgi:hypothetical protein